MLIGADQASRACVATRLCRSLWGTELPIRAVCFVSISVCSGGSNVLARLSWPFVFILSHVRAVGPYCARHLSRDSFPAVFSGYTRLTGAEDGFFVWRRNDFHSKRTEVLSSLVAVVRRRVEAVSIFAHLANLFLRSAPVEFRFCPGRASLHYVSSSVVIFLRQTRVEVSWDFSVG